MTDPIFRSDCLQHPTYTGEIYGRTWNPRTQKNDYAHRVVWEQHNDAAIPEGMVIMHTCDNPACVSPEHLVLGTQSENISDMYARGRGWNIGGEQSSRAKLSNQEAQDIRDALALGSRGTDLARQYGVSNATISEIKHGKRYTNV